MSGFDRRRRGGIVGTFTGFEADLIRSLAAQIIELLASEGPARPDASNDPLMALAADMDGPVDPPEDAVLRRLLPDGYRDDDQAAGDFRRFTEGALRDTKSASAVRIIGDLEEAGLPDQVEDGDVEIVVEVGREAAEQWLRGFTDIRLALAVRLGIETTEDQESWEQLDDDDPRVVVYDIYAWVGYLQETLVAALTH